MATLLGMDEPEGARRGPGEGAESDRLPDLANAFPLPEASVREFRERGHTLVRGLATPAEVEAYRPTIVETGPRGRYDHRPLAERGASRA